MSESLPPPPPPPGAQGPPPPPPGWTPPPTPPADDGAKTGLVIGIVVAVIAVLGVGAFFLFRDNDSGEAAPEVTEADLTIPEVTIPEVAIPDLTIPDLTIPDLTRPDFTLPDLTLPSDSTASGEIPPPTEEPDGLGDDSELDALAQDCYDGDMQACDDLYEEAPAGSEYRTFGDTCAGRQPALTQRFCINTFPS